MQNLNANGSQARIRDCTGLRRLVWRLANRRTYQLMSDCYNAFHVIRSEGLSAYRALRSSRSACHNALLQVRLRGLPYPVSFRPGTADSDTIIQSLIRQEYGQGVAGSNPAVIVDAGAFIGDASIYFHRRFPRARIIALEPNEDNHALAKLNLHPYRDSITLLKAGLWSHPTTLQVIGDSTGSRVVEGGPTGDGGIECTDICSLMARYGLSGIDLLKMDIEGAEGEVLSRNSEAWLPRVQQLVLEFHGDEVTRRGLQTLQRYGFTVFRYRSLHYCSRPPATLTGSRPARAPLCHKL